MERQQQRPVALQMCPFGPVLEAGLQSLFEVIRWDGLDADGRAAFLDAGGSAVRAVVTGGHIGCGNALMAALPSLGIISVNGVGLDKVDLDEARRRGIRVTNTPDALTADVADLAVGLLIDLLRGIAPADRFIRDGAWPSGEWPLGQRVTGRRFGIVGLGRIGGAIAARLAAFGEIRYTARAPKAVPYTFEGDLLTLARWADVLILACPSNAQTQGLIGEAALGAVGAHGFLVNVSRGSVVDEAALIAALDEGHLAGAALDVFENEPHVPEALRRSPKVILTPHIASATTEGREAMAQLVLASLRAFLAARPLPTAVA